MNTILDDYISPETLLAETHYPQKSISLQQLDFISKACDSSFFTSQLKRYLDKNGRLIVTNSSFSSAHFEFDSIIGKLDRSVIRRIDIKPTLLLKKSLLNSAENLSVAFTLYFDEGEISFYLDWNVSDIHGFCETLSNLIFPLIRTGLLEKTNFLYSPGKASLDSDNPLKDRTLYNIYRIETKSARSLCSAFHRMTKLNYLDSDETEEIVRQSLIWL